MAHCSSTARRHPAHRRVSATVPQRVAPSGRRSDSTGRASPGGAMNFNPSDLEGVLPALILAVGALVLLISEVFLRAVRPETLGRAGAQPVSPAERAEARLPRGAQGSS